MFSTVHELLSEKTHKLLTIAPSEGVAEAVRIMNQHNIGSLLVVEGGRLVGIFSERDVLVRVVGCGRVPEETAVEEVMTREIVTVSPQTSVAEAMTLMTSRRCRHLPVLERSNGTGGRELIGIISIGDVMRHAIRSLENEVESLTAYVQTGSVWPPLSSLG